MNNRHENLFNTLRIFEDKEENPLHLWLQMKIELLWTGGSGRSGVDEDPYTRSCSFFLFNEMVNRNEYL